MLNDLRYRSRTCPLTRIHDRGVPTLDLGIGVHTAIFSMGSAIQFEEATVRASIVMRIAPGFGLAGGGAASILLRGFLYGLSPHDPFTIVAVPALLLSTVAASPGFPRAA